MTSIDHGVRARMGSWPYEPNVAHLVLLDHQMVPTEHHVRAWIQHAVERGATAIRTGALFPSSITPFRSAGFETIDRLALLELSFSTPTTAAPDRPEADPIRTKPLRQRHLVLAAETDRRAFPSPWGNDRSALADVMRATPQHRARSIVIDRTVSAFAISGIAHDTGYLQRLTVDPDVQRRGLGRSLALDALRWMQRKGAGSAMVNTTFENEAALALYHSLGFRRRDESLTILELRLDGAT